MKKGHNLLRNAEDIVRSFNPVTHSVDTHLLEVLGDCTPTSSSPTKIFLQQLVYGYFKERVLIKKFTDDFYRDNSARVLRSDLIMYSLLAYLLVFRLEEIGVEKFRSLVESIEQSKICTLLSYLFDEEKLWNVHRSSWMIVKDLYVVENQLISGLVKFIPEIKQLINSLERQPVPISNIDSGKSIQGKRTSNLLPSLSVWNKPLKTKPPTFFPEVIEISEKKFTSAIPESTYKNSLKVIEQRKSERRTSLLTTTLEKYKTVPEYSFQRPKSTESTDKLRQEIIAREELELQFDKSFYNPPPKSATFDSNMIENMKPTVASILREDTLFKNQQHKDSVTLQRYEEELRDPIEFYRWQQSLVERDSLEKILHVEARRKAARSSSESAKIAYQNQLVDNMEVAELIRIQNEVIKRRKEYENEIEILEKQALVRDVIQKRESLPSEATNKVLEAKKTQAMKLRKHLQTLQEQVGNEKQQVEELKADRIRQLKALNTVHQKHVKVFDPTEKADLGLLDEMSYMEMKERMQYLRRKELESVQLKKDEISNEKAKKAQLLSSKYESILLNRNLRRESLREMREEKQRLKLEEDRKNLEQTRHNAELWEIESIRRNEVKEQEKRNLMLEQAKIVRQQQYLGVAQEQVALQREKELNLAKTRQERNQKRELKEARDYQIIVSEKERINRVTSNRQIELEKEVKLKASRQELEQEKTLLVSKKKEEVVWKKLMFQEGQRQRASTIKALTAANPYASTISKNLRLAASKSSD